MREYTILPFYTSSHSRRKKTHIYTQPFTIALIAVAILLVITLFLPQVKNLTGKSYLGGCDSDPDLDVYFNLILCEDTTYTINDSFRLLGSSSRIICQEGATIRHLTGATPVLLIPDSSPMQYGGMINCTVVTNGVGIEQDQNPDVASYLSVKGNKITAFLGIVAKGSNYVLVENNTIMANIGLYGEPYRSKNPMFAINRNIFSNPYHIGNTAISLIQSNDATMIGNIVTEGDFDNGIYFRGASTLALQGGNAIQARNKGIDVITKTFTIDSPSTSPNIISASLAIQATNTQTIVVRNATLLAKATAINITNCSFFTSSRNTAVISSKSEPASSFKTVSVLPAGVIIDSCKNAVIENLSLTSPNDGAVLRNIRETLDVVDSMITGLTGLTLQNNGNVNVKRTLVIGRNSGIIATDFNYLGLNSSNVTGATGLSIQRVQNTNVIKSAVDGRIVGIGAVDSDYLGSDLSIITGKTGISIQNTALNILKSTVSGVVLAISAIRGNTVTVNLSSLSATTALVATDIQHITFVKSIVTASNGISQYASKLSMNGSSMVINNNTFTGDGSGIGINAYQVVGSGWSNNMITNYATGMKITNAGIDNCCENSQNDCDASYGKCGNTCNNTGGTADITGTGIAIDNNTIINTKANAIGMDIADSRYVGIGDPSDPQEGNTITVGGPCIKFSAFQTNIFNRIGIYNNNLTCNTSHPVEIFVIDGLNKQQDNEFYKNIVNYARSKDPSTDPPIFINKRTYSCHGDYAFFPWFVSDSFSGNGNCYDDISGDGETQLCWGSDASKPKNQDLCDEKDKPQETYFEFPRPAGSCF